MLWIIIIYFLSIIWNQLILRSQGVNLFTCNKRFILVSLILSPLAFIIDWSVILCAMFYGLIRHAAGPMNETTDMKEDII